MEREEKTLQLAKKSNPTETARAIFAQQTRAKNLVPVVIGA